MGDDRSRLRNATSTDALAGATETGPGVGSLPLRRSVIVWRHAVVLDGKEPAINLRAAVSGQTGPNPSFKRAAVTDVASATRRAPTIRIDGNGAEDLHGAWLIDNQGIFSATGSVAGT